jgi:hypothetical protein
MIKHTTLLSAIMAVIGLLWVFIIININFIVLDIGRMSHEKSFNPDTLCMHDRMLIDSSLKSSPSKDLYFFDEKTANPFLKYEVASSPIGPRDTSHLVHSPVRAELFLKGILMRRTPYAIIIDKQGKSYICKTGDTLYTQKIIRIEKEAVTLRDGRGAYILRRM